MRGKKLGEGLEFADPNRENKRLAALLLADKLNQFIVGFPLRVDEPEQNLVASAALFRVLWVGQ